MTEHVHSHTHYHFLLQLADKAERQGYKVTAEMFRKMARDHQEPNDPEIARKGKPGSEPDIVQRDEGENDVT
jgi:hypothetical protein